MPLSELNQMLIEKIGWVSFCLIGSIVRVDRSFMIWILGNVDIFLEQVIKRRWRSQ